MLGNISHSSIQTIDFTRSCGDNPRGGELLLLAFYLLNPLEIISLSSSSLL